MDYKELEKYLNHLASDLKSEIDLRMRWHFEGIRDAEKCARLKERFGGTFDPFPTFGVGIFGNITLSIKPKTAKYLKHYLRRIRQLGYKRKGQSVKHTSTPQWEFKDEEGTKLVFIADFSGNKDFEDACKMVQVGSKTVEQPVYELVCPDGSSVQDINEDA